jgi:hypothetical protein
MLFHQLRYALETLRRGPRPPQAAMRQDGQGNGQPNGGWSDFSKVVMQIVVSLIVLGISCYLLVTNAAESAQKGAFGLIGLVVGYWLR